MTFELGMRLGGGAFGVVHASVCGRTALLPPWASAGTDVAVKVYPSIADGLWAVNAIADTSALLGPLVDAGVVVPLWVASTGTPTLVMPVCTRPANSMWRQVVPLAEQLLAGGLTMSDIKPANLGLLNGRLTFLDVEAISKPTGAYSCLGSFPVVEWHKWGATALESPEVHRNDDPAWVSFYSRCNTEILSVLRRDAAASRVFTRHAALATAMCMKTGAGNPQVTDASVADLDDDGASLSWARCLADAQGSELIAAARGRNACLL